MRDIVSPEHYASAGHIKNLLAVYREAQDLINIGAYKKAQTRRLTRPSRKTGKSKNSAAGRG
jgi:flagellum-specific ATP synthase